MHPQEKITENGHPTLREPYFLEDDGWGDLAVWRRDPDTPDRPRVFVAWREVTNEVWSVIIEALTEPYEPVDPSYDQGSDDASAITSEPCTHEGCGGIGQPEPCGSCCRCLGACAVDGPTARDELADLCLSHLKPPKHSGGSWTLNPRELADAILAAGYAKRPTFTRQEIADLWALVKAWDEGCRVGWMGRNKPITTPLGRNPYRREGASDA